jgi:cyclopropane fatty-acyl-phospholipid synthase-like methyltransferase
MSDTPPYAHSGVGPRFTPEELYVSRPPWDIGRPQPAFLGLFERGEIRGRVLDVGCGTGEHVLMCAERGLSATGIDLAASALQTALSKARERGLSAARFVCHDVLRMAQLGETFDTVLDCGLFHMPHFTDADRVAYVDNLRAVLVSGGRYFMLCFSDRQPGDQGPRRVTRDEITTSFTEGWRIDSIEPTTIEITTDPAGIRAWLVAATRT